MIFFSRKSVKIFLWVLLTTLLLFFAGEITLRFLGYQPWNPQNKITKVLPGGSLFLSDDSLGYRPRRGKYKITLENKYTFTATHDSAGHRIIPKIQNDSLHLPEMWIFGCSFTYGWGVNDAECWPALVADALPEYHIHNYAAPAYGTLQSLIQLRDELRKGKKPAMVVLSYGGFHNQRNICCRYWKKALEGQQVMEGITYPYCALIGEEGYKIRYSDLKYQPWPFSRQSAFIHFLEQQNNASEETSLKGFELTRNLILEIRELTIGAGGKFIVAKIWRDKSTDQMVEALRIAGVKTIDISTGTDYSPIYPGDAHPGVEAHRHMAKKFLEVGSSQKGN